MRIARLGANQPSRVTSRVAMQKEVAQQPVPAAFDVEIEFSHFRGLDTKKGRPIREGIGRPNVQKHIVQD